MIALDQQLADTRQELERLRATNRHTALRHRLDMATMKRRKAALERQYKQASETELGTNSNSLVYAQAMSKSRIVSISVLYVEAKLCRTEHQLGALEHQAHIQKKMCSDVCDQMDTLMDQMNDEKKGWFSWLRGRRENDTVSSSKSLAFHKKLLQFFEN